MEQKKRVRLTVSYDGTNYHGWQVQENADTIEAQLNRCLTKLLGEEIHVIGASRTDAGVHALSNIAVFDTTHPMPAEKIAYALNNMLPEDIRVQESAETAPDWHPRRVQSRKTYEYHIYENDIPTPIGRQYHLFTYHKLEDEKMRQAARFLLGEHDFKSFCQTGAQVETTVRTIYEADVERNGKEIVIRVCGNGFLYNMVRIIAGTLMDVGMGRRTPEDMQAILEARDRAAAGPTAPAQGLILCKYEFTETEK